MIGAQNTTAVGSGRGVQRPLRQALALLVIAVVAIAGPTIALARATAASAPVKDCGAVHHNVAVTTQGGVKCSVGRKVANGYLAGNKHPSGFNCKRIRVQAGSGWQGRCTNRTDKKKRVQIIPE